MDDWMGFAADNENVTEMQHVGETLSNPDYLYDAWQEQGPKEFLSVNEISTAVASVNEKATEKQSVGTTKGNHIFQTPISRSHDTKMVLEVNSRKRSIQQHQHAFKNSNFSWTVFQLNPII